MVHGSFDEVDAATGVGKNSRSFDRTFILGPGAGVGGIRVMNDMLCLRAFSGSEAWLLDPDTLAQPQVQPQIPHPEANNIPGYAMPMAGKPERQVQEEIMILEMSMKTRLNLGFAKMALEGNGWNAANALRNFEEIKVRTLRQAVCSVSGN